MKVFIYERVSSEEQARHGYSLDAQHEALTDFCKKNNHVILGEYRDEGISARKPYTKRPAMLELLQDVEIIKPDMILFTKLDRWFRNIKEYYRVQDILDKNNVNWKAINEEYDTSTASGRLYVNIKLSIAQDEADRTSERIKDVQSQQIAKGLWLGGRTPFGYKLTEDNHLVFDDNIGILREAIDYYLMHQALKTTVRYINERHGTNFSYQRLKWAFEQPTLKGEYRGNPNFCEPIVSAEEFDRLQSLMKKNIKHNTKRTYLFTGLIKCPHCGRNMSGIANGDPGKRIKYYRCRYFWDGNCDFKGHIRESKLEEWMLENIEEDFKVNVTMKPKEKTEDPKKYKDRLKRLNEMYLMGNISQQEYKDKSAELQQKIAEIQKKPPLKTQNFASNWKDIYALLDDEHKRSFWRNLVTEIAVNEHLQVVQLVY